MHPSALSSLSLIGSQLLGFQKEKLMTRMNSNFVGAEQDEKIKRGVALLETATSAYTLNAYANMSCIFARHLLAFYYHDVGKWKLKTSTDGRCRAAVEALRKAVSYDEGLEGPDVIQRKK